MTQRSLGMLMELTDTALETFRESDRLLAVQAGNHYDQEHDTHYGAEVVHRFMQQLGLRFEPPRDSRLDRRQRIHTPQEARIMQAVDMAVGEEIGAQSEFAELVGSRQMPGGMAIGLYATTTRQHPDELRLGQRETPAYNYRPYFVNQLFANDRSWYNFSLAASAIRGIVNVDIQGWLGLHEEWRATLGQIRTLHEALPGRID